MVVVVGVGREVERGRERWRAEQTRRHRQRRGRNDRRLISSVLGSAKQNSSSSTSSGSHSICTISGPSPGLIRTAAAAVCILTAPARQRHHQDVYRYEYPRRWRQKRWDMSITVLSIVRYVSVTGTQDPGKQTWRHKGQAAYRQPPSSGPTPTPSESGSQEIWRGTRNAPCRTERLRSATTAHGARWVLVATPDNGHP